MSEQERSEWEMDAIVARANGWGDLERKALDKLALADIEDARILQQRVMEVNPE